MINVFAGAFRRLPSAWASCAEASSPKGLSSSSIPSILEVTRSLSIRPNSRTIPARRISYLLARRADIVKTSAYKSTSSAVPSNRCFHIHSPLSKSGGRKPPKRVKKNQTETVPFRNLDETSLQAVFGTRIPRHEGNAILRTIHQRRVSGELADLGLQLEKPFTSIVSSDALKNALQWLRINYPVDEQAAAERWAVQEEARLGDGHVEDAEGMGIYKAPPPGESVLEHWIQDRKQKQALEQKQRDDSGETKRSEEMQLAKMEAKRSEVEQRKERSAQIRAELHRRYEEKHSQREVPNMTVLARLGPSTLFAVFVVCSWVIYAEVYTPPLQSERLFPNLPASLVTIGSIAGINLLVYFSWHVVKLWHIMHMGFTVIPSYPYALSVLGNCFSHQEFTHLFANMLGLVIYGIPLHEDVGRGNFLALYVSGGVAGSLLSLYYYVLRRRWQFYSRGASGCIFAVMMAWAWMTAHKPPKDTSSFAFAWDVALYASILIQFSMHFTKGVMQKMDVFAHLGGATTGLFGGVMLTKFGKRPGENVEQASNEEASEQHTQLESGQSPP